MSIDTERFSTVPLFEGLAPLEISELLKVSEDVIANAGDVIVKEGDPGDGFYVIGKGAFDVVKGDQADNALARLEELSFFGEVTIVAPEPRTASVICVEDGRLKRFPSSAFNRLLGEDSLVAYKVVRNMARILAQRFSRLEERFVDEVWKSGH